MSSDADELLVAASCALWMSIEFRLLVQSNCGAEFFVLSGFSTDISRPDVCAASQYPWAVWKKST